MEHDSKDKEELFTFKLQELFDGRYVLKEGEWKIVKALVIGVAGLILTGVVVAALAFIIQKPI